jgi:hypothetical protein
LARPIVSTCTFSLLPGSQSFAAAGGLGSIKVNTGAGCAWNKTFSDTWITPIPLLIPAVVCVPACPINSGNGPGPGTLQFAVAPNTGAARSGNITVGGQQFQVKQGGFGPPCTFSISPTFAPFDASGGDARIIVNTANGCAWTATSNAGWLTIVSGAQGAGTAAVVLQGSPNTGGARSGTATIAGQTFTAMQAAPGATACGAQDLTASQQVRVSQGSLTLDPDPGLSPNGHTQKITVINQSGGVLPANLYLVLVGVPNHQPEPYYATTVFSAASQTTCFTTQGDAMFQITAGPLAPGSFVTIDPIFLIDPFASFSYTPKVLSGPPSR